MDFEVDRADFDGAPLLAALGEPDGGAEDADGPDGEGGKVELGAGSADGEADASGPATLSVTPSAAGRVSDFCVDSVERIP